MTPADKRISELLDRWLASIELHLKYTKLDAASYQNIQPWPEHERPTRWILEVAQQKVLQLKSLAHVHAVQQDSSFAEALELMCFLANLVGAQNIKRFIPIADPAREQQPDNATNPVIASPKQVSTEIAAKSPPPAQALPPRPVQSDESTREMPELPEKRHKSTETTDSTRQMPQLQMPVKREPAARVPANSKRVAAKTTPKAPPLESGETVQQQVVADAVRLLKWGREWHELPDLIARMAERPGASEIRRIIKSQRTAIERQTAA